MHQSALFHLFSVVAFEECLNLLETMYLPLIQEYQLTVLRLPTDVKKKICSVISFGCVIEQWPSPNIYLLNI